MTYYLGDPCYIIPDDDWGEFCELTFAKRNQAKGGGYLDSIIHWHGQDIEIWSNGGDGTWSFNGLKTTNDAQSFGVDAGIFCVINLDLLPAYDDDPARMGMVFDTRPDLRVDDGVVYINDKADNSMSECWECGTLVDADHGSWSCDNGCCEGCENCFECRCEEEE